MQRHQQWVIGLAIATTCVCFALVALAYANDWWLSFILTFSILAWLSGVLWTVYCRPGERAIALGALIAGFLYIVLALGPWFRGNVGPWLLTSRAFHFIDTQLLKREVPQAAWYQAVSPPFYPSGYGSYSMGVPVTTTPNVWTSYPPVASTTVLLGSPSVAVPSTFAAVGHWLSAWLAAGMGALAAGWIARRGRPRTASTAEAGENPFGEAQS